MITLCVYLKFEFGFLNNKAELNEDHSIFKLIENTHTHICMRACMNAHVYTHVHPILTAQYKKQIKYFLNLVLPSMVQTFYYNAGNIFFFFLNFTLDHTPF